MVEECGPADRQAAAYRLGALLLDRRNIGDTAAAVTLLGEGADLDPGGSEVHQHIVYRLRLGAGRPARDGDPAIGLQDRGRTGLSAPTRGPHLGPVGR
ncbi:hypothetical protein OHB36_33805 [Streptomyces sp. NBC_00320]|uniref:hypothetical protein n=1 Tax=unclassified Streptomyces TaxID=2593676 RepID=UPI0022599619|nr:hypothetical protein [Streptomyces sp. NBC_00320]MCX5151673.1 hypothetical protein [Streptomyces sp. NBC_00320]